MAVALAVCLLGTVVFAAHPAVAQESGVGDVRVVARSVAGDRVEFAVQQHDGDGWGRRVLPTSRLFPLSTTVGRWLVSSPVDVDGATVRVAAARTNTDRVEFALQHRTDTGWTQRLLPTSRFFPISTQVGRWLVSSPVSLTAATTTTAPTTTTAATTSVVDEEQACRDILPDTYPDDTYGAVGVEGFCAGANDAPNVIRIFICTPTSNTPGFDLRGVLFPVAISYPISIQAGTRIEWHPDPDCGTHTISMAFIVIDPNYGRTSVRGCYMYYGYTGADRYRPSRHQLMYVERLNDGRVRIVHKPEPVGGLDPC